MWTAGSVDYDAPDNQAVEMWDELEKDDEVVVQRRLDGVASPRGRRYPRIRPGDVAGDR